ncbi:MAG: tyrosine-type recombinase/integrase [Actinobacteria bacterium]|nr:tyrosine-type recombinase/integrase [Actinomycetota bacterium]MBE3122578.1 tyrosine-type recombinase/integrase [Thermoplasmata archaeon]
MSNNVFIYTTSYSPLTYGGEIENKRDGMIMGKSLQDYETYLAVKYRKGYTRKYYYHTVLDLCRYSGKKAYEIEKNDIDNYIIYLNNKGLEHNTINDYIIRINIFVTWLDKSYLRLKMIGFRQTNKRKILTLNELVKIRQTAKALSPEHYLIAVFITDLNARPIEICNAKLSDLCNNKFYFNDSKTGDSYGFPTQDFLEAFEIYKSVRPKPNEGYEDYILIGKQGRYKGRKYEGHGCRIRSAVSEIAKAVGIEKHITPYDLRASVGTQEFNLHVNPKVIQRKFRHRNLKTTMLYNHVDDKMVEEYASQGLIFNKRSLLPHDEKDAGINDIIYKPFSPHDLNKLQENENLSFSFSHSFFDGASFLNLGLGFQRHVTSPNFLRSIETNLVSICPAPPSMSGGIG